MMEFHRPMIEDEKPVVWTHSCCVGCWNLRNPDRATEGSRDGPLELCCFCGKVTKSGIYVREDSRLLDCGGAHRERVAD